MSFGYFNLREGSEVRNTTYFCTVLKVIRSAYFSGCLRWLRGRMVPNGTSSRQKRRPRSLDQIHSMPHRHMDTCRPHSLAHQRPTLHLDWAYSEYGRATHTFGDLIDPDINAAITRANERIQWKTTRPETMLIKFGEKRRNTYIQCLSTS